MIVTIARPQWVARIEVLAKGYELDAETIQLVEEFKKASSGTGYAITGPDQNGVETTTPGIGLQTTGPRYISAPT